MIKETLREAIRTLSIDKIETVAHQISTTEEDHYLRSYAALRDFISGSAFAKTDDFVLAAHLVYAWMPRVLKLEFGPNGEVVDAARRVLAKA